MKLKKKESAAAEKTLKKSINATQKEKKKAVAKLRKTIKAKIREGKKLKNKTLKEEKKERKAARKEGQYQEVTNDVLKNLVNKYKSKIADDLVSFNEAEHAKILDKEERQKERIRLANQVRLENQKHRESENNVRL